MLVFAQDRAPPRLIMRAILLVKVALRHNENRDEDDRSRQRDHRRALHFLSRGLARDADHRPGKQRQGGADQHQDEPCNLL